jgi:hypothetical protein
MPKFVIEREKPGAEKLSPSGAAGHFPKVPQCPECNGATDSVGSKRPLTNKAYLSEQ